MNATAIRNNGSMSDSEINGMNVFASREGLACVSALIYRNLGVESSVGAKREFLGKYDVKTSGGGMLYLRALVQAGNDLCKQAFENGRGDVAKLREIRELIERVWSAEYLRPELTGKGIVTIEVEGEEGKKVSFGRFPELAMLLRNIQGEYDAGLERGLKRAKDARAFEAELGARRQARFNNEFLPRFRAELRRALSALRDLVKGIARFIDPNVSRYREIPVNGYVGVDDMLALLQLRPSLLMSKREARRAARSVNKETGLLPGMIRTVDLSGLSGGFAGVNA